MKSAGKLGWRVETAPSAVSAEARIGSGEYNVRAVPRLSGAEEQLLCDAIAAFKESAIDASAPNARERVKFFFRKYCAENEVLVGRKQFEYLSSAAAASICGFGVLDFLLCDDSLEEISALGPGKQIYVYHRTHGWLKTNCFFTGEEAMINAINKMARPLGRRITLQAPTLNAVLPDGSRLHASMPPVAFGGLEMTIRKFRETPISVADLVRFSTYTPESLAFLWLCMQADISMLVCGNTSSGKTSTLNALFSFVPLNERIVITEETPEMRLPHQHVVRLAASSEAGIGLKHLIADTLRMRPDRVIVGEARTAEEACALFDTLQSGQARGAYGTFHAQSAAEALQRLRTLGVCGADLRSLDVLVVQRRMTRYDAGTRSSTEVRRATEICEVHDGTAQALFAYEPALDALTVRSENSRIAQRLCEGFGMSRRGFEAELRGRAEFLGQLAETGANADAVLSAVQRYAYDAGYKDSFAKRLNK